MPAFAVDCAFTVASSLPKMVNAVHHSLHRFALAARGGPRGRRRAAAPPRPDGQRAELYTDSELRPASRYITTFPLTGYIFGSPLSWDPAHDTRDRIQPGAWALLEQDLERHPPCFIVDTDAARMKFPIARYPYLARLVAARYRPAVFLPDGVIHERLGGDCRRGDDVRDAPARRPRPRAPASGDPRRA